MSTLHPLSTGKIFFREISLLARTNLILEYRRARRNLCRSAHWGALAKQIAGANDQTEEQLVNSLVPWRTGPFILDTGFEIESEWRSEKKWDRIRKYLPDCSGQVVADIGCSTGYHLTRLLELDPKLAVGFDPNERCWLQFAFLSRTLRTVKKNCSRIAFLPFGLDALKELDSTFDLILCMGVIYHQRDPLAAVKILHSALKPGGTLILESLIVPQEKSLIIPADMRYAKMRNAWQIPSLPDLRKLFLEAGFQGPLVEDFGALSTKEQRQTKHSPYESLIHFLKAGDLSQTIEGYPAPHTGVVVGVK